MEQPWLTPDRDGRREQRFPAQLSPQPFSLDSSQNTQSFQPLGMSPIPLAYPFALWTILFFEVPEPPRTTALIWGSYEPQQPQACSGYGSTRWTPRGKLGPPSSQVANNVHRKGTAKPGNTHDCCIVHFIAMAGIKVSTQAMIPMGLVHFGAYSSVLRTPTILPAASVQHPAGSWLTHVLQQQP